eukprot:365145-Chlamydomonas_euryale.AAC.25
MAEPSLRRSDAASSTLTGTPAWQGRWGGKGRDGAQIGGGRGGKGTDGAQIGGGRGGKQHVSLMSPMFACQTTRRHKCLGNVGVRRSLKPGAPAPRTPGEGQDAGKCHHARTHARRDLRVKVGERPGP